MLLERLQSPSNKDSAEPSSGFYPEPGFSLEEAAASYEHGIDFDNMLELLQATKKSDSDEEEEEKGGGGGGEEGGCRESVCDCENPGHRWWD